MANRTVELIVTTLEEAERLIEYDGRTPVLPQASGWRTTRTQDMSFNERTSRLSYEESCRMLQELGYTDAGADGTIPPMPDRIPQYDDEEPLGVSFFRTFVGEEDLENLTLPRTFFGRSEIGPLSFRNTDLSESNLCWNDFNEVNFEDADLSGSDLRASLYNGVKFVRANLSNTDLRLATFDSCDFTDAKMQGAKLSAEQVNDIDLTDEQRDAIDWQEFDGEEPRGG